MRRCAPLATTVVLTAAVSLVSAAPAAAEGTSVPRGDGHTIQIKGHGYGHGHGMSQHGAQGAAKQGRGWRHIIDFYYPGTSLGRAGGRIKVWLTADTTPDVQVRDQRGLRVRSLRTRETWQVPRRDTRTWRLKRASGDTRVQFSRNGRWRTWKRFPGPGQIGRRGTVTLLTPSGSSRYRGGLRGVAGRTVNVISLEKYLRGVVPLEMPALWEPAAVRSQAVAARTYAAFERRAHRGAWHVQDTTASQVYGGADAAHPAATDAIRATRRRVVRHDGAPALTQFSASSGGWTAAGSRPYLVHKKDPYDDWSGNDHHTWRVRMRDGRIERFARVGDLRKIVVRRHHRYRRGGRAVTVTFRGSQGTRQVSGEDVRWGLGLKSTWFRFRVVS